MNQRKILLVVFNTVNLEDLLTTLKKQSENAVTIFNDIQYEYKVTSRLVEFPYEYNLYRFDKP